MEIQNNEEIGMTAPTFAACPVCGAKTHRDAVDLGREESRLRGDEGHDLLLVQVCPEHGRVKSVAKPEPCLVCGSPATIGLWGGELLPDWGDHIPGYPTVIPVCGPACLQEMRARAIEAVEAAIEEEPPVPKYSAKCGCGKTYHVYEAVDAEYCCLKCSLEVPRGSRKCDICGELIGDHWLVDGVRLCKSCALELQ